MIAARLLRDDAVASDPLARRLAFVVEHTTGRSSAGFAFLAPDAYALFRDTIPHLLGMGPRVLDAVAKIEDAAKRVLDDAARENVARAAQVVSTCVNTASITAPSDLWLVRHVVAAHRALGIIDRLLDGEALAPEHVRLGTQAVNPLELEADLTLLLSRGLLEQRADRSFVASSNPRARAVLAGIAPRDPAVPANLVALWSAHLRSETLEPKDRAILVELGRTAVARTDLAQSTWIADLSEVELGYRLLPVVLALRATGSTERLIDEELSAHFVPRVAPQVTDAMLSILRAAGVIEETEPQRFRTTPLGARVLQRGPGPMGIIEAYHPYMERLDALLTGKPGSVWVARGTNIAASQEANRATFEKANDALDRFCAATGFEYRVFIEHAIGRGEATRQRFTRSGDAVIRYFGADLEDAAIDAAIEEQRLGRLPRGMEFIRHADIGDPSLVVTALEAAGVSSRDAVMLVGNGFHEVRGQTDARMVEVFRGYHDAGIVLLFTEESALSVDDLQATAWNTYHAGFKYVHEKSGQALRPAEDGPPTRLGRPLRASWHACARAAGYVRVEPFSTRTRTIYPLAPASRHNPSISVSHFVVPRPLAERLKLA
jgi:hypothetical protein